MVVEALLAAAAAVAVGYVASSIFVAVWGNRSGPEQIPLSLQQTELSEYDKEKLQETQGLVNACFCQDGKSVTESVREMSNLERIKKAEEFANQLAELYELDIEIDVDVNDPRICGGYTWNDRKAQFNLVELMTDGNDPNFAANIANFIDTVIHEERHAVQHRALLEEGFWRIDEERRNLWTNNLTNYIRPEVDIKGYRLQPIENDAFTFANLVMEGVNI